MSPRDTVLVLTCKDDAHADHLVPHLIRRGVRVARYDTGDFPLSSSLVATLTSDGWHGELRWDTGALELNEVLSVWYRRPGRFRFAPGTPEVRLEFLHNEALRSVGGVLRSLPCRWVNHPDDLVRAEYKPWQLQVAARHGLRCPRSLVTNDPRAARRFFDQCEGSVIYKLLGTGLIVDETGDGRGVYTSAVQRRHLSVDNAVRATSCLFQENISKNVDLRITVVGHMVIPVAIYSQEKVSSMLDWRSDPDDLRYSPHELPQDVRRRCLAVVRELNLTFAALDMILTPTGEYVFLEVNPNGQWAWLEHVTRVNIHDALADELTRPIGCDPAEQGPSTSDGAAGKRA